MHAKKTYAILFILGAFLLIINIVGLIVPLRNKKIYRQSSGFHNDITLTKKEAFDIINKPLTNKEEYIRNVNYAINKSILHYWVGEHEKDYHIILPFYENYLLATFTRLFYTPPYRYEFCNYKKTLERGVGWCSQVSIALADLLNKKNIPANVIAWAEHTVVEVKVDKDKWWVVDPDFNVIMPYDLEDIEKNPTLIAPFYKNKLPKGKTVSVPSLIKIYSKKNNAIYPEGVAGYPDCDNKKIFIEKLSYILIWILPFLFILPYIIIKNRKKYA